MKFYNNIDLLSVPTEEQHIINKKVLKDEMDKLNERLQLSLEKAVVCIVDDDGTTRPLDSYTGMTKWLNDQNIPMDFAICYDTIGTSGKLTISQLNELKQKGNDIISHGMTKLQSMQTIEAVKAELNSAKKFCMENGFEAGTSIYVYPAGLNEDETLSMDDVKNAVGDYFEYGLNVNIKKDSSTETKGVWNKIPLSDKLDIARMEISDTKNLTTNKKNIDLAIKNKGLLILFTHSFRSGFVGTAEGNYQDGQGYINFKETITYLKEQNVEFMTLKKALAKCSSIRGSYDDKQDKRDISLKTANKTIVGAINEIDDSITDVIEETSTSNDIASAKGVYKKLYKTVTETIVDVPEHYELSTDGTGLTIVDDDAVPVSTEIRISDVNAKLLESDEHNYAIGEVVKLVAEVNHQEDREKEIYAKKEDIPESSTTMSIQEFNEMWGEVTVIS